MNTVLFQRSLLAAAISSAVVLPNAAWSGSLLDGASAVVELRTAAEGYQISGFDMVALPGGSTALVWVEHKFGFDEGEADRVLMQQISATGQLLGSVQVLAESATETFEFPTVAGDQNGNLAVAWTVKNTPDASFFTCSAESDSIRGLTLAPPYTTSADLALPDDQGFSPCSPKLAMDDDGDFVLVWSSESFGNFDLNLRTFQAGGVPFKTKLGLQTEINSFARLALQDNQTMLLSWIESGTVLGQRLDLQLNAVDSFANPNAAIFALDGDNFGSADFTDFNLTADSGGGFAVTLTRGGVDSTSVSQMVQRWKADRSEGDSVTVITETGGSINATVPQIASDSAGNLLTLWNYSDRLDVDKEVIVVAALDRSSQPLAEGSVVLANLSGTAAQGPFLAMNDDVIAVSWIANGGATIEARFLAPLTELPSPVIQGESDVSGETEVPNLAGNSSLQNPSEADIAGAFSHWLMAMLAAVFGFSRLVRQRLLGRFWFTNI
ncbi:hypothetical protein [Saccharospirillum mangrovi]|uniref:hypothetical protein n=1 Tax=Saccharospirillum mangrovi TaxID=2161747 RepID=UPI000D3BD189|nr:hypothetical protein [Saccharospirillum mangrovi]